VFKHKSHNMEFNFNGASAEESQNGINMNLTSSAFGDSNKQNVNNLKARVCGTEGPIVVESDVENRFLYFSVNIKIKEGFEDTHNLCDAANNLLKKVKEEGKGDIKISFVDGRLFIRGHMATAGFRKWKNLFNVFAQLSNAFKD